MELQIRAIKDGIVIDHISSDKIFLIVELLNLKEYKDVVTVAFNLNSSSLGKKGLIKIANKNLDEKEIGEIALLSENATINFISDYKVVNKVKLQIPEKIKELIKCNNNKCITNHENVESLYLKQETNEKMKFKCVYCERIVDKDEINLNKF